MIGPLLQIAGAGAVTAGTWITVSPGAGLIVAGLALLAFGLAVEVDAPAAPAADE